MAKEDIKVISYNRKAGFDYELIEFYEAGIVLTGTEVKSLRAGAVNMRDSYGYIKDYEAYVSGLHISHYDSCGFPGTCQRYRQAYSGDRSS